MKGRGAECFNLNNVLDEDVIEENDPVDVDEVDLERMTRNIKRRIKATSDRAFGRPIDVGEGSQHDPQLKEGNHNVKRRRQAMSDGMCVMKKKVRQGTDNASQARRGVRD
ncbi:uncharacterized protein LOC110734757 isoform X2 [Chenopodium quinoa]|uniref:uncharacterized protein LOC110734757 isoform X2 n=1 Tax=Chenopodium quinoa TaxID=63459 RepID=UPI000B77AF0E|nr:uncharacterized protein LOC110734757 isoform X2 [Chenopodium quinoa]